MNIHLLGYSESTISRILSILAITGYNKDITIVQNLKLDADIPFCPPEVSCRKVFYEEWQMNPEQDRCILAVMKPVSKKKVFDFFHQQFGTEISQFITIAHPSAVIDSTARISNGCIIEPMAVIASFARLEFGVYVNRGCTLGHHTVLEEFVSINPGVHVAGHCKIGRGSQIGIGAVVFDHVSIGSNSIIGGGSVVTKDIPSNVVAWGSPCKVIKKIGE